MMWSSGRVETDAHADRPDLTAAVLKMDNELHEDDITSLKFLCQGLLVGKKLHRVDTVHDIADLLASAKVVTPDNFFLLADLLQYIGRIDVLQQIGFDEREVMVRRNQEESKVKPFYVLLFQIAEELAPEDVKRAKFAYGKVPKSQTVESGLDLFTVMVQHQALRPDSVGLLVNIFRSLGREDIVELVNKYTETEGASVMHDLEQRFVRSMTLSGQDIKHADLFPPRPQRAPGKMFESGRGPSIDDIDVRAPTECTSDQSSLINQPPSTAHSDPSAPPLSLPPATAPPLSIPPTSIHSQPPNVPTVPLVIEPGSVSSRPAPSVAPHGYDQYVIPWDVMDTLSRVVPAEFWPELSYRLEVPITGDWSMQKRNHTHNLSLLKRWLDLPETRVMDPVSVKLTLVRALIYAGPTLLAQQVAEKINIDYTAALQESTDSQGSAHEMNEVSSAASAAMEVEILQQGAHNVWEEGRAIGMPDPSLIGSPIPFYPMDRKPRGICLIINNRDFYLDPRRPEAKRMGNREGTDVDRDKLVSTFEKLDFQVHSCDNQSDADMLRLIQQHSMMDHRGYDIFVCCILTHGVHGALYGVNGITVPTRDLTAPLRAQACPSLAGKPKLFFMQACQGRDKQGGLQDIERDCVMEEDSPPAELIPNEADFLLGYATVPGFVSYRSKTRGSWYITKLTETLNKYAYDHDFLDILTLVNFEVGKGNAELDGGVFKQSPAPMYSLRKKLIFMP